MGNRAAKVLGSLLVVPAAAALYLGAGGVAACGRGARRAARALDPPRRQITVLLGEAGGFHFAFSPLDPEADRSRRDAEALAKRFALPGSGLARLHVLRFGNTPAPFDPRGSVARAISEEGEEVTLRPLVAFRVPAAPRDALVFRALAGPTQPVVVPAASWIPLGLVVPAARDPERFRRIEVSGAILEPAEVDLEEWKAFLASPKRDFFRRAPSSAPASR